MGIRSLRYDSSYTIGDRNLPRAIGIFGCLGFELITISPVKSISLGFTVTVDCTGFSLGI